MSKKINIVLFIALIIFIAFPFFHVKGGSDDVSVYISGVSLLPGLDFLDAANNHSQVIRENFAGIKYFLLLIIPVIEIIFMSGSIHFKNEKKQLSVLCEVLCYIMNFIGLVFVILSINENKNFSYELSFGYYGMVFVYVLIFAVKILDYLIGKTPSEAEIWPKKGTNTKKA